MKTPTKSSKTSLPATRIADNQKSIAKSYSERFVLIPNQVYSDKVEGVKLFMINESGKIKRVTFWIEDVKEFGK